MLTTRLEVGEVGQPKCRGRSTEIAKPVDRSQQVGPPKSPRGSGDCPQKVVGTIYRRLNNSPTAPFQRSAVQQTTLRRTPSNSPPYFDASKAESLVKQGGEFRHIERRFSPWTTEILIEQGGVMPDVTKGIARTAPLNAWNDGETAVLRQSPQPPEQARGV